MSDSDLLIALRIKGFAKPGVLAGCLDREVTDVEACLSDLEGRGLVAQTKIGPKLTRQGQDAADAMSAAERLAADTAGVEAAYTAFNLINGPFKALVADWQTRSVGGETVPNDHSDPAYDRQVIERLRAVHGEVLPVCGQLTGLAPRFGQYERRFCCALAKLIAEDHRFFAAPIIDSYHTVWFELHEDLIRLSGRSRAAEALAGKAV